MSYTIRAFCKDCMREVDANPDQVEVKDCFALVWMWRCSVCDRWIKRLTDDEAEVAEGEMI